MACLVFHLITVDNCFHLQLQEGLPEFSLNEAPTLIFNKKFPRCPLILFLYSVSETVIAGSKKKLIPCFSFVYCSPRLCYSFWLIVKSWPGIVVLLQVYVLIRSMGLNMRGFFKKKKSDLSLKSCIVFFLFLFRKNIMRNKHFMGRLKIN